MKIDKFTSAEIEQINRLFLGKPVNAKKDYVQDLIINRSLKSNSKVAYICFTGFGKTRMGLKFIDRYNAKFPDEKINVVSPTVHLQRTWAKERQCINSYVINTFSSGRKDVRCGLMVVDEVHHALGLDSVYFSTTLDVQSDYKLALSATLAKKHYDFLSEKGFQYVFKLSIDDGIKLGLLPTYKIINLPVTLTLPEKIGYASIQDEIVKNVTLFSSVLNDYTQDKQYFLEKLLCSLLKPASKITKMLGLEMNNAGWLNYVDAKLKQNNIIIKDKSSITGVAKKIQLLILKRDAILGNAHNKIAITPMLIKRVTQDTSEKVLVFTKSVATSIDLKKSLDNLNIKSGLYNSKVVTKNLKLTLEAFYANVLPVLITIDQLKEGFDVKDVSIAIRVAYNGTTIDAEQIAGRILRIDEKNPEKTALLINLYVDEFMYAGVKYKSLDVSKLESAYVNLEFKWLDSIDDYFVKQEEEEL